MDFRMAPQNAYSGKLHVEGEKWGRILFKLERYGF